MTPLGHLADDPGGLTGDNAKTRNDHVWGDDGAVEDAHIVLDDGKLADGDAGADVHMAADGRGLDDGPGADKNVVDHAEGHVSKGTGRSAGTSARDGENAPLVHSPGGPETAASAEEAVSADGDGGVVGGSGGAGRRWGGDGSGQVAADHNLGLDDCLAAEHDVLGADEGGFSGDLVARVLGGLVCVYRMGDKLTVSIYSPLGGLLDMVAVVAVVT